MELINLDVGGTIFRFTKEALIQYPDTFLGAMFTKDIPGKNTYEENGKTYYFFDNNPGIFRIVANFYRSGRYDLVTKPTKCSYKSVAEELDFWCIPEEACSSPEIYKVASLLCNVLQHEQAFRDSIVITSKWFSEKYWVNGVLPDEISISNKPVKTASLIEVFNKFYKCIIPPTLLINALRRKGIDVKIESRDFECGVLSLTLIFNSNSTAFIGYTKACCNGGCAYVTPKDITHKECRKRTDKMLTIRRID